MRHLVVILLELAWTCMDMYEYVDVCGCEGVTCGCEGVMCGGVN